MDAENKPLRFAPCEQSDVERRAGLLIQSMRELQAACTAVGKPYLLFVVMDELTRLSSGIMKSQQIGRAKYRDKATPMPQKQN